MDQQQSSATWNPEMISIEAELQAVERDFFSGKCGAFETADAQHEVATQLSRLKGLENELFSRSKALWDWSHEEQGLWQSAMHRQQQSTSGSLLIKSLNKFLFISNESKSNLITVGIEKMKVLSVVI